MVKATKLSREILEILWYKVTMRTLEASSGDVY